MASDNSVLLIWNQLPTLGQVRQRYGQLSRENPEWDEFLLLGTLTKEVRDLWHLSRCQPLDQVRILDKIRAAIAQGGDEDEELFDIRLPHEEWEGTGGDFDFLFYEDQREMRSMHLERNHQHHEELTDEGHAEQGQPLLDAKREQEETTDSLQTAAGNSI